jgi:2-oxoglutarate ferredoxin oxidoreductase subunit delta
MAKVKLNFREDRCKGCGLCTLVCPKKGLVVSGRLNNQGYNVACLKEDAACTGCAFCAQICPDVVIEIWKEEGGQGGQDGTDQGE